MLKPKKLITIESLLDKLTSVRMVLLSNILLIQNIRDNHVSEKHLEMIETAISTLDEITSIVEKNGLSHSIDELFNIIQREIDRCRVVVLDPNRKRVGAPIVYSNFHPDFKLELYRPALSRNEIIIDIKKCKWVKPEPYSGPKEKGVEGFSTKLLITHLSFIRSALLSCNLSIHAAFTDSALIESAIKIPNEAIKTIDHIIDIFQHGVFSPDIEDLYRIVNRGIISKQIFVRDAERKRAAGTVIYTAQHPEFSLELSLLDPPRDAVIIKIRKSSGLTKGKMAVLPSDDLFLPSSSL